MHYPSFARSLMATAGFEVHISGKRKELLLSTCDRLFADAKQNDEASVQLGPASLRLRLENPSERLLFYAPHNLLRSYRNSPLFSVMSRLSAPFALFVDIGANLGLYSLLARLLGMQALLFEPEPVHFAFLARNADTIGTPVAWALSDQSGTTDFFVSGPANPGSSSLVMPEGGWAQSEYRRTVPVPMRTFDAALSELSVDPGSIRLIKIDVEGNEEHTVRGMREYLAAPAAAPIWCEVRGTASGRGRNSVYPVTEFLARYGYTPFRFEGGTLVPYRLGHHPAPQVFDLLFAVPKRHAISLGIPR